MSHLPWHGVIGSIFAPIIFAASTQSLVISHTPAILDENAEAEITVNLTCSSCSTDSFLRGVFYPNGTSYFGYVQSNDGTWTNVPGSSCTQYFKVLLADITPEGTWSGKLKVKVDKESTNYNGPGEYLFKVGRYTPSCSSASIWSNEVTIAVIGPTHTPTPSASPTMNPTLTPSDTPQLETTQMSTISIVPSKTSTPIRKPIVTLEPAESIIISDILGRENSMRDVEAETLATPSGNSESKPLVFSLLCIGTGFGLIATVLAWKSTDVWKNIQHQEKNG